MSEINYSGAKKYTWKHSWGLIHLVLLVIWSYLFPGEKSLLASQNGFCRLQLYYDKHTHYTEEETEMIK